MFIKRTIQPGYNTGHCSIDLVEKVNCDFAKQVYAKYLSKHYGVDQGLEDNYDEFLIKKNLLELNLIDDPDFCKPVFCCEPCGVRAVLLFVKTNNCQPPNSIQVIVTGGSISCIPPNLLSAVINYNN